MNSSVEVNSSLSHANIDAFGKSDLGPFQARVYSIRVDFDRLSEFMQRNDHDR